MRKAEEPFLPLIEGDDDDDDEDGGEYGSGGGGGGGECHINRLPDELLFLIFNKLVDAKCLCKCNLVSRRFSTIILQIHSVSLTIPPRYTLSEPGPDHDEDESNLPKKFVGFLVNSIFFRPFRFVRVSIASKSLPRQFNGPLFRAAVESLKKFNNIQKLRVQLPAVPRQKSLLKWHAEFGDDFNVCVILFATSCRKMGDVEEGECEQANDDDKSESFSLTDQLLRMRIASANQCFSEALWRHHILHHVVEDHRTLQSVEITDSSGEGTVCLKEKHVADMLDPEVQLPNAGYAKVWHFQVLQLPLSGYVMEGVSVFAIRHTDVRVDGDVERLNTLMDGAFEGEEDLLVYKEIMRQRYENDVASMTLNLNAPQ